MKYVSIILAVSLLGAPCVLAREQTLLARVTVYWHGEGQQLACSNGARLRNGHCAVDPKKIPYGSRVLFEDGPCLAVDTGPAVISRKAARLAGQTPLQRNAVVIDRYFETRQEALAWADAHPHFMKVEVIPPGSESKNAGGLTDIVETNISTPIQGNLATPERNVAGLTSALSGLLAVTSPFDPHGSFLLNLLE